MPKSKTKAKPLTTNPCPHCAAKEILNIAPLENWPQVIEYFGNLFSQLMTQSMKGALPESQFKAITEAFAGLGKQTIRDAVENMKHPDAPHSCKPH